MSLSVPILCLAHYCNWHVKCSAGGECDSWRYASTIPRRKDAQPDAGGLRKAGSPVRAMHLIEVLTAGREAS